MCKSNISLGTRTRPQLFTVHEKSGSGFETRPRTLPLNWRVFRKAAITIILFSGGVINKEDGGIGSCSYRSRDIAHLLPGKIAATEMEEEPGRLSLNVLLQRLEFIQDYWYKVGETLNVSDEILHELRQSPQANASSGRNLMVVIIKWIEANQGRIILPLILEPLRDAQFIQENGMLLEKLNNLQVSYRRNSSRKCACPNNNNTRVIQGMVRCTQ